MQKFTETCTESQPTKLQDEIAVTAPTPVKLLEITRTKRLQDAENHLYFVFVLRFTLVFEVRSPTLN